MTKLSEVVDSKYGFAFRSAEFSEGAEDIRLLRGDNIGQGRLRWDSAKRFPVDRLSEVAGYELQIGDVVVAMDRPWIEAGLKYAVIRPEDLPCLLVQRVARLRAIEGAIDPGFLGAIIGSPAFTNYVIGVQTGSAVPHISGRQVGDFEFDLPVPMRQKSIADILGALDDKIAANRSLAQCAEGLQCAFWNRAASECPQVGLLDIVEARLGGTPRRSDESSWDGAVPWASVRDMTAADGRVVLRTEEGISENASSSARRLNPLPVGTVVLTARGTVGKVVTLGMSCAINQSAYAFVPPNGRGAALRCAIESAVDDLKARSHGSVFSTITTDTLRDVLIPDITRSEWSDCAEQLEALESRRVSALRENLLLARTRDELLPLLMDGRISIREAQRETAGYA